MNEMNLAFIVQARLGSTRLPNKILLPFSNGGNILDIILEKLKRTNIEVLVATSESVINNELVEFLKSIKIPFFRGSEDDVLLRFIEAARANKIDGIIRVCSDNPFLDYESLVDLITAADSLKYDYIGFKINGTPSIKTHFGFWAEFVTLKALERINSLTQKELYHEHVTNYIYTHPNDFNIKWLPTPDFLQGREDIRLTIDTEADFDSASKIYHDLIDENERFSLQEIVRYLDTHPHLLSSMKKQIQNNSK